MRVAHFIQRYPPALGGSETYFARLSRYLAGQGDWVTVFTSNALDLEAFWSPRGRCVSSATNVACAAGTPQGTDIRTDDGVEVRRYPLWRMRGRRYLLKPLSWIPHRLWQCLTLPCNPISLAMWRDAGTPGEPFDLVHASAFPYAWPIACARRLARRLGVPFVLTPFLHLGDPANPRDRTRRAYTAQPFRWLLRQADLVFVQTPAERQAALDLGVPEECVVLQGLGVDPAECTGGDRAAARAAWKVAPGEVVVGHFANLSAEKGTIDLLEAAALLWQRGHAARFVLAGPDMPNFRRFWERFRARHPEKCRDAVVRTGVLDDQAKRDFFAGIDVFALPSRSDSFGLVLLEAWANGVPNVVYRAGGPAEIVRHAQDGLLAPCGDISALAEALAQLTANEVLRRDRGEAGRRRTQCEFRWEDKLALVRRHYEECVREARREDAQ